MVCYCCVKGCNNNSNSAKKDPRAISFHAFPSNFALKQKWLRAIGRPAWNPPSHVRICSAHFSTDQINQDGYRTRIKEDACPVNALPPNSNFEASNIEVCRLCLATDVKMFSLEIGMLKNCMEAMSGIYDNKCNIEGMPKFVCYECAEHMTKFYNLIEKSMTAQAILLDIFAENGQITKSLVRKRDRQQLNLQSTLSNNYSTPCHFFEYMYNDEDNISCLKKKYFTGDKAISNTKQCLINSPSNKCKSNIILNGPNTEDMVLKSEGLETTLKIDDDDPNLQDGDDYETENISDIETNENGLYLLICCKDNIKPEKVNYIETKNVSAVSIEKNKVVTTQDRRLNKRSKSCNGLTPDEVEMEQYFNIVQLSEQEQIEEWNKVTREPSLAAERAFKCEVCFKLFASKNAYKSHVACHDPKLGASACPVCKHRFKNEVLAKSHANRTHGKKFRCKSCSKVCNSVSAAKKHHRRHSGHVYRCARCAFTTAHASALAQHARTQHANAHACAECGHAFVSARGLALHASTAHREDKNETINAEFRCEECGINFTSEGARRVHVLTSKQHEKNTQALGSIDPLLKMTCKQCGKNFPTKKELVDHSRTEHRRAPKKKTRFELPGDSYPTQCEHCGCEVNNRREHYWHVRREHPALRHHYRPVITAVCETCGKGFQNETKLRIHELRHGSPTLRCASCARMFHDKYALARHAATHAPRDTHACRICGRAFALKGNLRRHERVHTDAAPYPCRLCGKRFRHSGSERLHVRTVHLRQPHPPRKPRRANAQARRADDTVNK